VVMTMQTALLTLAVIGAMQQVAVGQSRLDGPPTILNLGSNANDGSVSVTCTGTEPYSKLSCRVYYVEVTRTSLERYQESRAALQKDLATTSETDLMRKQQTQCANLPSAERDLIKNLTTYSPGRAASAREGYEDMKAFCACATKQCITSLMLAEQTHDQDQCTVYSTAFSADFMRVNDRKWVSNYGPEGICGVVSLITIEHEEQYSNLWTYTEQDTYTNNNADAVCKLAHNETKTYSWKAGKSVRLKCEELKFDALPEGQ
jgi:hypothetical protein